MADVIKFVKYLERLANTEATYEDGTSLAEDAKAFLNSLIHLLWAWDFFVGDCDQKPQGVVGKSPLEVDGDN